MMREGKEDIYEDVGYMKYTEKNADTYDKYRELGGIINRADYEDALHKEMAASKESGEFVIEAGAIARHAGIELENEKGTVDPRAKLFAVLRSYQKPGGNNHHGQMGDQHLFAEALRMLGDSDALEKLIKAYPNMDFN
ncbi:hypothetical protein A2W54_03755 [Candidatus Giovannonibacteria bacterium RIFCSPHIGHO2_02_43_13]|uniref:Uncharacterized protein n=1 Tax=Candidatus Giovannonibacteria bacterium RIFCSPHIGHO2_02_43_13 TaxID=1798330 RepID=A0A1F5WRD5_9BACT|nr:MAG: hypothetical protein UW28_C0013G0010 [Parcubacteria group bacterium GW2011_GWA2_44_13]OGF74635.1 MAG: hypothetical protein A3E06_02865 [Candidatus Giovannonibacteria bacterium RIFCSPHIGHO2_12_FULL_44_42]OGF78190.1 MAG: hypothetical protein A2W54_03755 [Candidatus Giovannonibacteria bacterium RIFCSPHIGHO2_02_43_13]OGF96598.1 MAG: hypothetical protein A3H08_01510 [Candidatus Giovannonibacteria bacterium RIFCSPLOWO2_12_FULL_44_32]